MSEPPLGRTTHTQKLEAGCKPLQLTPECRPHTRSDGVVNTCDNDRWSDDINVLLCGSNRSVTGATQLQARDHGTTQRVMCRLRKTHSILRHFNHSLTQSTRYCPATVYQPLNQLTNISAGKLSRAAAKL